MNNLEDLPDHLFWDVQRPQGKEGWDRFYFFVIERVLQRGTVAAFSLVRTYYGDDKVKEVFKRSRSLDRRVQAFGVALFGDEGLSHPCSPIPFDQKLWNY